MLTLPYRFREFYRWTLSGTVFPQQSRIAGQSSVNSLGRTPRSVNILGIFRRRLQSPAMARSFMLLKMTLNEDVVFPEKQTERRSVSQRSEERTFRLFLKFSANFQQDPGFLLRLLLRRRLRGALGGPFPLVIAWIPVRVSIFVMMQCRKILSHYQQTIAILWNCCLIQ